MTPWNKRLPDDDTLRALIRFGFTYQDIADRWGVKTSNVSQIARRLGLPKRGGRNPMVNGAPMPWTRKLERWLENVPRAPVREPMWRPSMGDLP